MTATGIGARVRRKEDQRFITGKGRYTDDFNRPGQAYAHFLRSPHAHAQHPQRSTRRRRVAMPGVVAVLTGDDLAADKIGGLICGWMIHSKDGTPMKAGPHPALAQGKVRYVGDHVAVVIAETAARRPRTRPRRSSSITRCCRRWSTPPRRRGSGVADPRGRAGQHRLPLASRRQGRRRPGLRAGQARHAGSTSSTTASCPTPIEPRAAIGEYDAGTEGFTLYTTSQNPHVARLVLSAFIGIAPEHKLRVIAPDVGGGFGSKIFIYAEETVCVWAAKKVGRPVKWTSDRTEAFLSDAHGRDHVTHAELARRTRTARSSACASRPSPISAPTSRPSRRRCRPISTRRCSRASTTSRRSIARSTASTPTRRRSTPIAAPAGRRRPSSSSGSSRWRRASSASIRRSSAGATTSRSSRTRRRSS